MQSSKHTEKSKAKDEERHESDESEMHGEGDHEADQRYRKRARDFLDTQEGTEATKTPVERTDEEAEQDKAAREEALKKARH